MGEQIARKLRAELAPLELSVVDDSDRHAGHAGSRPEGETHFTVKVVSRAFAGKSRLERHRMIHALLSEELSSRVHALAITAEAPAERSSGESGGPVR
jgi:BolA protein